MTRLDLAALREQAGLTRAEVAELMEVSKETVRRWDRGLSRPYPMTLRHLLLLYGVPKPKREQMLKAARERS